MNFIRIESTISTCDRHLSSLDPTDPMTIEIESYIVSSVVLAIISEYEVFIESLFKLRAEMCGDRHVVSYVVSQISQKFRSPDMGKIFQTLAFFGTDYRDAVKIPIENTVAHASWDNIMRARHAIVHKKGVMSLTFRELKTSYEETKSVLKELLTALSINPVDVEAAGGGMWKVI